MPCSVILGAGKLKDPLSGSLFVMSAESSVPYSFCQQACGSEESQKSCNEYVDQLLNGRVHILSADIQQHALCVCSFHNCLAPLLSFIRHCLCYEAPPPIIG